MKVKNQVTASVLIIGNEILSGRTVDQNLNTIALFLEERAIQLVEARVVMDIEEDIIKALNELRSKYHYVFTTGGIGPTHDDITAASVSKAFGLPFVVNPVAKQMLSEFYGGDEYLNEGRLQMASMPQGAELIQNSLTVAPGFKIENVFVLAGIPKVMQVMLECADPYLKRGVQIVSDSVTCYCRETEIAKFLKDLQQEYEEDCDIGSYPFKKGEDQYGTQLVVRSYDSQSLAQVMEKLSNYMKQNDFLTESA